jgi:hypothetical protein
MTREHTPDLSHIVDPEIIQLHHALKDALAEVENKYSVVGGWLALRRLRGAMNAIMPPDAADTLAALKAALPFVDYHHHHGQRDLTAGEAESLAATRLAMIRAIAKATAQPPAVAFCA